MELTNSQRIAAALERSTDALTRIADSVDLNAYQQGYHDGVRDEAPDMSAALEAEYQRGRADAAKVLREMASEYQQVQLATTAAAANRREADTLSRIAAALRIAADRIEAGQ